MRKCRRNAGLINNLKDMDMIKKIKCSLCNTEFANKKNFNRHMKWHQHDIDIRGKVRLSI